MNRYALPFLCVLCCTIALVMVFADDIDAADAIIPQCTIVRDAHGHIVRSRAVVDRFRRLYPCPAKDAKGQCVMIADHVQALSMCGADHPANLAWQS